MDQTLDNREGFEAKVASRFGILPNFFRSASAAPELIQRLWGFAEAGYLDNPMPSLFKERLFVYLSRFCRVRYCIVRHVGFLLGLGRPSGDAASPVNTVEEVVRLLRRPTPWNRDMPAVYQRLTALGPISDWPASDTESEDLIFACAVLLFSEPGRSERARRAVIAAVGERHFEFLAGFLAFVRAAHYWTMLHPQIEIEDDMVALLRHHEELARLLWCDPEAERCEMGERLFEELTALRELNERRELEKAKHALEERDRQKDQFIAVLAHELRNPLAAIRAATDALALAGTQGQDRSERFRALVDRQCVAMSRILEDLLDASRIALGKVAVEIVDVDFSEAVRNVVSEFEPRARAAGLDINLYLPDALCYVRGDRVRLQQVVGNLLSNAIKFTPSPGRIVVQVGTEAGTAVLRIEDSGIGFSADVAARLFEPFFQAETDFARSSGGLGLGLAISARLAELQDGRLSAVSDGPGRGATFSLTMALAAGPVLSPASVEKLPRPQRGLVLLVEDNGDVAHGLAEVIRIIGFDVDVAPDGRSALARARAVTPDLIICDLGLPNGMDGYAVARACKSDPALRSIRLIAASGYSRPEDHANANAAGFEMLIPKPITLAALRELLSVPSIA
jgi:signal transduction histidine kinase/CheY-like chemotaxis protein